MAQNDRDSERGDEAEGREIKVTDRRKFLIDGSPRPDRTDDYDISADDPEATTEARAASDGPAEEPPAGRAAQESGVGFERRSLEEPEGIDFTMLLNAMAQPALIFLGEIPHPGTGKPEIQLEQARAQIDLLDVLRIKCRGNLTPDEESLLDRILYQLRMLYVARSNQPGS